MNEVTKEHVFRHGRYEQFSDVPNPSWLDLVHVNRGGMETRGRPRLTFLYTRPVMAVRSLICSTLSLYTCCCSNSVCRQAARNISTARR